MSLEMFKDFLKRVYKLYIFNMRRKIEKQSTLFFIFVFIVSNSFPLYTSIFNIDVYKVNLVLNSQ